MESLPGWMESIDASSMENDTQGMNLVKSSSNVSELMNFDAYAEWCKMFPSFASSPLGTLPTNFSPFDGSNFTDPYSEISMMNGGIMGQSPSDRDRSEINSDDDMIMTIPRSPSQSLSEKMLRAMHFLKELCGEELLTQLWVPMRSGNQYILTTSEQPYLLDQNLMGYREVSRLFTFSAETGPFTGLPGRVFLSRIPEWTSNVMYYNKAEFLRLQHAFDHKVRGSIALPIFEDDSLESCSAVLELVTEKEKPDFNFEIENIWRALEVSFVKVCNLFSYCIAFSLILHFLLMQLNCCPFWKSRNLVKESVQSFQYPDRVSISNVQVVKFSLKSEEFGMGLFE